MPYFSAFVKIPAAAPIKVPSDISGGGGQVGTSTIKWTVRSIEVIFSILKKYGW